MGWGSFNPFSSGGLGNIASAATGGAVGGKAGSQQAWGTSINQNTPLGSLASPIAKAALLAGGGYLAAPYLTGAGAAGAGGATMPGGVVGAGGQLMADTTAITSAQAAGLGAGALGAGGIYGATGLTGGQLGLGLGGIGAALYGTQQNKNAMEKAAQTNAAATQSTNALQADMFNRTQENQRPWLEAGQRALGRQETMMNNPSSYQQDPYNAWLQEQGNQGINRSAAAKGMLNSGNVLAELSRYNQGVAGQGYADQYNRWAGLSGTGQTTANQTAQQAGQYAANVGNMNMQNAQMQGNLGMAQAGQNNAFLSNLMNTGSSMYGMYNQNQQNNAMMNYMNSHP